MPNQLAVCCQHGCSDSNPGFLYLGNAASSRVAVPRTQNTAKRQRVMYINLRIKAKPVKKLTVNSHSTQVEIETYACWQPSGFQQLCDVMSSTFQHMARQEDNATLFIPNAQPRNKALRRFYQMIMVANAPPKPYILWSSFGGEPLDRHNKRPCGAASSSGSVQAGWPCTFQRRKTKKWNSPWMDEWQIAHPCQTGSKDLDLPVTTMEIPYRGVGEFVLYNLFLLLLLL